MKLVYGVGINDADYVTTKELIIDGKRKVIWKCPFYVKWLNMIERCYSEKFHIKNPTYSTCTTAVEWHYFTKFKSWMQTQDWEGKQLDKDLLIPNNTVYGPDSCIFVDSKVNGFLNDCRATRGELPIGVSFKKQTGKFAATCHDITTNKNKHLGYFKTAEEAYHSWLQEKFKQAKILASQQTDKRVAKALIDRYENYLPS